MAEVNLNESVNFTCTAFYEVSWTFGNGWIPTNSILREDKNQSILDISAAKTHNSGVYTCFYEQDMMIFYGEGQLFVVGKPENLYKQSLCPT